MRILVIIAGLLAGLVAGTAVLLLRPAQWLAPAPLSQEGTTVVMKMVSGIQRGSAVGPFAALGLGPPSGGGLGETSLQYSRFGIAVLDGGLDGGRAIGVKLAALGPDNSLLAGHLGGEVAWNVIWPGLGSIFLVGEEDYWPELADAMRAGARGDGFTTDGQRYLVSRHGAGEFQGVVGASGRLQTAAGSYDEWKEPAGPTAMAGQLDLTLRAE